MNPEPLTSVDGPASATMNVAVLGGAPVNVDRRGWGRRASPLSVPLSGSKLATPPTPAQLAAVAAAVAARHQRPGGSACPSTHGASGMNDSERWRASTVPATTPVHAPLASSCSTRTLPVLQAVPRVIVLAVSGWLNVTSIGWFAGSVNGWYSASEPLPPAHRPGLVAVAPVSAHGTPGWTATTVGGTPVATSRGVAKLTLVVAGSGLPARSATSVITIAVGRVVRERRARPDHERRAVALEHARDRGAVGGLEPDPRRARDRDRSAR